jgi:TonB family protein
MRTFAFALALSLTLLSNTALARQSGDAPFAEFDRQLKSQPGGWAGDKGRLSGYFDGERKRLGRRFESELMKYIRGDVEKHYWISFFLESPSYLHGNTPLPHLSLLIKEQGLSLARNGADEESRGFVVGLGVTAAVLAEQLGLTELAIAHKAEAERLLAADKGLSVHFPGMVEEERTLYRSIGAGAAGVLVSSTGAEEDASMPRARVMGGILNGKAVGKPLPAYPAEARAAGASGEVRVQVVVDEAGKVIWAKAAEGHELLRGVAEDAARRATFQPMTVQGKPEKVMGFLIYKFVP